MLQRFINLIPPQGTAGTPLCGNNVLLLDGQHNTIQMEHTCKCKDFIWKEKTVEFCHIKFMEAVFFFLRYKQKTEQVSLIFLYKSAIMYLLIETNSTSTVQYTFMIRFHWSNVYVHVKYANITENKYIETIETYNTMELWHPANKHNEFVNYSTKTTNAGWWGSLRNHCFCPTDGLLWGMASFPRLFFMWAP